MSIIKTLLLVIFPPLGVALHKGIGGSFLLNLILTLFGYVPGLLHGIWLFMINENPEETDVV